MKSYTFYVNFNSLTNSPLLTMSVNPDYDTNMNFGVFGATDGSVNATYTQNGTNGLRSKGVLKVNQWTHIAVVMDPTNTSMTMYINGAPLNAMPYARAGSSKGLSAASDLVMKFINLGGTLDANIAFFHMYDRVLTPSDITRDINYMKEPDFNTDGLPTFATYGDVFGVKY